MPPSPAPLLPEKSVEASRYQQISPRTQTVEALARILEVERVVHVRGTPSSGKTILANLLLQYYERRGDAVVMINGWHNIPNPITHLVEQGTMSRLAAEAIGACPQSISTLFIMSHTTHPHKRFVQHIR